MTAIPFMPMAWADFFSDPKVQELPFETRGVYAMLLGVMWLNQGWLPSDDQRIAKKLQVDVRTWRSHRRHIEEQGLISRRTEPFCGEILVQSRLSIDWANTIERVEKIKARTAAATAERSKKSKKQASVTVHSKGDRNVDRNVDRSEPLPARDNQNQNTDTPPKGAVSGSPLPPPTPGAPSLGHEGRSSAPPVSADRLKGPFVPAQKGARRTNDWDLTPTPGPIGQTRFLKKLAAFKDGDKTALDPHPDIPNRANPALSRTIRQQLGLEPSEENDAEEAQADEDDGGIVRNPEQPQSRPGLAADQAGTPDGPAGSVPGDPEAEHPDHREPDAEEPPVRRSDAGQDIRMTHTNINTGKEPKHGRDGPSDDDIRDFLGF